MHLSQNHLTVAACLSSLFSLVSSHTVITYPGWRGNNLHSPGDIVEENGLGAGDNGTYPYGMQWIYPCTDPSPAPDSDLFRNEIFLLTIPFQAEACPYPPTEHSGPSPAALSASNLAGSLATRLLSSISISAKAPSRLITLFPWYQFSRSQVPATSNMMVASVSRKCLYQPTLPPRLATMRLSRSSSWRSMARRYIT